MKERKKRTGLHSMKYKVLSLVFFSIIVSVVSLLLLVIPMAGETITDLTHSYMLDLADACGHSIDEALASGKPDALEYEHLHSIVGDVQINDLDNSYAYIVAADGTMLYHPTQEKVGEPVENSVVQGIVERLSNGETVENDLVSYDYHGTSKYASYYITKGNEAILVITADAAEVDSAQTTMYTRTAIAALVILLLLGTSSFLVSIRMTHPLMDITKVIDRFSSLDLTESAVANKIAKRSDETGQIARATVALREKLVSIVSQIKSQSELLYNASTELDNEASLTTSNVENVETAVHEIATGATSQASETQRATDDIIDMGNMIEHTNTQVESLSETANLMRRSSDEAANTLRALDDINRQAISSIDIIYEQTNTTNASALKIKEATTLISSIAEETNLLSLNASIEAARAGDAGRGFAVVASQIQKLADQSNESAMQIDAIIHALLEDSEKAVQTMEEVKDIMNQQSMKVQKTGEVFQQVRNGISHSLSGVSEIADKTARLDHARSGVVDVVQNLTAIAQENAASTQETSASVMEVSNVMQEIMDNANRLKEIASVLEQSMASFTL